MSKPYGKELILDLHACDASLFTRVSIVVYFERLAKLIGMRREARHFWDDYGLPPEECQTEPHLKGTTAIQFLLTSNITIHTLDLLEAAYINIFSCKDFDSEEATRFTVGFFRAKRFHQTVVGRT